MSKKLPLKKREFDEYAHLPVLDGETGRWGDGEIGKSLLLRCSTLKIPLNPTFRSPTDETQKKSPKNRNLILKKKVNPINGRLVSVNNPLTNFCKASNSQESKKT